MNHIYKVIWSKAKHCYVVASEIAKSHGKSASAGKRALVAAVLAAAAVTGAAMPSDVYAVPLDWDHEWWGNCVVSGEIDKDGNIVLDRRWGSDVTISGLADYVKEYGSGPDYRLVQNERGSAYKADQDGTVSLHVQDKEGKNRYDVKIEDVASKTNLDAVGDRVTGAEKQIETNTTNITANTNSITAINKTLDGVVKYDVVGETYNKDSSITLAGKGGTQIHNVKAGDADNDAVNVKQLNDVKADVAKGWTLSTNGEEGTAVTPGAKVDFSNEDKNVVISRDGTSVTVDLAKNLNAGSLTTGSFVMDNSGFGMQSGTKTAYYITKDGLNANGQKITGVAAGADGTDAVNFDQLEAVKKEITAGSYSGWNVQAGDGEAKAVAAGKTVTFKNSDGNMDVSYGESADGNVALNFKLSDAVNVANSITVGGETGIQITGAKDTASITGLSNTSWTGENVVDNRAATEGQLQDLQEKITAESYGGWNVQAGDGEAQTVKAGDTVKFQGDENVSVTNEGLNVSVKLNDEITLGNNGITLDGTKGTLSVANSATIGGVSIGKDGENHFITGLSNTSWTGENVVDNRAATEGQLQDLQEKITAESYSGWKVQAGDGEAQTVKAGDTVKFQGDENVSVTNEDLNVSVKLNDEITLGNNGITLDGTKGTLSVANSAIIGGVSIGKSESGSFIKGLSNTTWNKDAIVSGQAATEDQLKAAMEQVKGDALNSKTKLTAEGQTAKEDGTYTDGNIQLQQTVDETTGQITYDVKLSDTLKLGGAAGEENITINGEASTISLGRGENQVLINGEEGLLTLGDITFGTQKYYHGGTESAGEDSYLMGLGNTSWDFNTVSGYKSSNIAATEGQLYDAFSNLDSRVDDLQNWVDNFDIKGDGNITVTPPKGEGSGDGSSGEGSGSGNGSYVVKDSNTPIYGNENEAGKVTVTDGKNSVVIDSVSGTMSGLNNTEWDASLADKEAADGGYKGSTNAATESQLQQAMDGAVQYDDADKGKVTFGGNEGTTLANVANGKVEEGSKEAVNGGQLYDEQQARIDGDAALGNQINDLGRSVSKLGGEIDSVGAISAALAGLHPLDYDPTNSKYQLSAALGSYDGSSAVAFGGFYNINKDILLSAGVSTVLKGERKTAGNLGVTFRVGSGSSGEAAAAANLKEANQQLAALRQDNKVLATKNDKLTEALSAQGEKLNAQGEELAALKAQVEALLKGTQPAKTAGVKEAKTEAKAETKAEVNTEAKAEAADVKADTKAAETDKK